MGLRFDRRIHARRRLAVHIDHCGDLSGFQQFQSVVGLGEHRFDGDLVLLEDIRCRDECPIGLESDGDLLSRKLFEKAVAAGRPG